jgi:hypothetical protein
MCDVPPLEKEVKNLGLYTLMALTICPMLILMLITLDPMVGSDQRNHVHMVVTLCSAARCIDHPKSDLVGQLVVVDHLYVVGARHYTICPTGCTNLTVIELWVRIGHKDDGYGLCYNYCYYIVHFIIMIFLS